MQEMRIQPLDWEDRRRRKWRPTPVFLPVKSHAQRSLAGHSHGATESRTQLSNNNNTRSSVAVSWVYWGLTQDSHGGDLAADGECVTPGRNLRKTALNKVISVCLIFCCRCKMFNPSFCFPLPICPGTGVHASCQVQDEWEDRVGWRAQGQGHGVVQVRPPQAVCPGRAPSIVK